MSPAREPGAQARRHPRQQKEDHESRPDAPSVQAATAVDVRPPKTAPGTSLPPGAMGRARSIGVPPHSAARGNRIC